MNEDQEPKTVKATCINLNLTFVWANTSIKDSRAMTIKFLRGRLLSERSVSKTAMQRAQELSKRVMELEEQLKFTCIQRKKAEKAILAIVENLGTSDMPEGFDSNSDQDGARHDLKTNPLVLRETSTKNEASEMEAYYSSEIVSTPSTDRSLTWKSTKDSQYSLQKKKQMDSIRRRTSFASHGSSARRAVKSCRRIRRRETRAVEEFQNDGPVKASFSRDVSNSFDGVTDALRRSNSGKKPVDSTMLESESGSQKISGRCIAVHERDKDMESALQNQAQLIGQYEEEEKAQREWEEKFRESNHCEQDSGDPGNRSDVTEERNVVKFPEVSDTTGTLCTKIQETRGSLFREDPQAPKCLSSLTDVKRGFLQDLSKSSESKLPILERNGVNDPEISGLHSDTSRHTCTQYTPMISDISSPSTKVSSYAEKSMPLFISPNSSSSCNLSVGPQETPTNLGSVLEALRQAKSSLQEKLNSSLLVDRGTLRTHEIFKIPTGSHALLRLPSEDQHRANTIGSHPDIAVLSNFSTVPDTRPYVDPRMALSNEVFFTVPSSTFTDTRYRVASQRSLIQPRPGSVPPSYNQTNHIDPNTNLVLPSVKDSYPFLHDFTPQLPLKEGAVRASSSSKTVPHPIASSPTMNLIGHMNW
ncbi:hypothetical protein F511_01718 [Dorcoceras hygrometricum]|uniref:Uncharacterized protein n=1 Tax=Dorcoceras hygrometricum TaxID=472368 RepID=A0A2Z7AS62_9LAMI|nr:hypothetical protein F511_01718 [Dorcoceras hygrometricum]